MKLSLAQNICRLRKQNGLTQERLAEALGVSFAAVSKWERGAATPDLALIADMADLFSVSLDALAGFELQQSSAEALARRLLHLQREKRFGEAVSEAEEALRRYPNDFRVVYRCGSLYELAGLEQNRPDWLRRGRDLLERSLPLLSQNTDPAVSDIFIQYHIAQCCLKLGEGDQALEILKKTNICGVHNALIALILSSGRHPLREAESYLTDAMGDLTSLSVRLMTAYVYYYQRKGDDSSALDALQWLCHLLDSLKTGPDAVSYVDKILACCCAECAHLSRKLGRPEEAEDWLRRACRIGTAFDAAPTYRMDSVKFCAGTVSEATVYDDLGESALASVERQLTEGDHDDELLALWRQLCAKEAQKEDQP